MNGLNEDNVYNEKDVDNFIDSNNGNYDAEDLLNLALPKHIEKLDKLDKQIMAVLSEIKQSFPDAQYYTAGGGFTLSLGETHDDRGKSLIQRQAWCGNSQIGDGDW